MEETLDHKDWEGRTGGMPWMQRALVRILALTDQRIVYGVMALIVPFYMLLAHRGYAAQYAFFRRRLGEPWWRAFAHVYANHFAFGQIIIDRFAVYGGRRFRVELEGFDTWQRLAGPEGEGFVQLSSHVGNYELAGYMMQGEHRTIHALVFEGETATVMRNRSRVFTPNNIRMVPVMPDLSHIFELNAALSNGDIVSMPGDRIFGSQKVTSVPFFGTDARFPVGPFLLAVTRGCPIVTVFCMKEDWQTYRIHISLLPDPDLTAGRTLTKRERTEALTRSFVGELERIVRRYPTQWFNYYDFWQQSATKGEEIVS